MEIKNVPPQLLRITVEAISRRRDAQLARTADLLKTISLKKEDREESLSTLFEILDSFSDVLIFEKLIEKIQMECHAGDSIKFAFLSDLEKMKGERL